MPRITCVCPTTGARRDFLPHAIRYFLRQTWKESELLVVGDGPDPVHDLIPDNPRVRYVHLSRDSVLLGEKYNRCVTLCESPWIALWADDDWQAPWRLTSTMEAIRRKEGAILAGSRSMLFLRIGETMLWKYSRPGDGKDAYALGGSVVFHRIYWEKVRKFDYKAGRSADASFPNSLSPRDYRDLVAALPESFLRAYVATIHPTNTGRRDQAPSGPGWSSYALPLEDIMGEDAALYGPLGALSLEVRKGKQTGP